MGCPATTASGSFCLAWPVVWAIDSARPRRRKTKGSTASLAMLGRIFVYWPPQGNLRHYAIFQGANRAANVNAVRLKAWLAGTTGKRQPSDTPPRRSRGLLSLLTWRCSLRGDRNCLCRAISKRVVRLRLDLIRGVILCRDLPGIVVRCDCGDS